MNTSVDETGEAVHIETKLTTPTLKEEIEAATSNIQIRQEQLAEEEEGKEELDSAEKPSSMAETTRDVDEAGGSTARALSDECAVTAGSHRMSKVDNPPTIESCDNDEARTPTDFLDHEERDDDVMNDRSTPFGAKVGHLLDKKLGHHATNLAQAIHNLGKSVDISAKILSDFVGVDQ